MVVEGISGYHISKLLKKQYLPVIRWNEKHLLKQVITITYILEKIFFVFATFQGLGIVSLQTE